jgi:hypothetical protein
MSFARYFKLSSYCLIGSGFLAIAATGALDVFSLIIFTLALTVSWFLDTEGIRRRVPTSVLNAIAVLMLPLFFFDYLYFSRKFVVSTIHMILSIASVKLLTRSSDRDYVYLYMISLSELLAASTLTIDLTYLISLFLFLLSSVTTLILFEMKRSSGAAQKQGSIKPAVISRGAGLELFSRFPARSLTFISLGMTVTTLLLAVPIFLVIPRISLGFYNRPTERTQMVSGFSETVELGEIGTIKESATVVMRVKLDDSRAELPRDLKWRGIALDHYDGRSWSRSRPAPTPHLKQGQWFKLEESMRSSEPLLQHYFVEALSTNVLFTCPRALAISSDIDYLERDSSDSFFTRRHPSHKIRYTVLSDITEPDPSLIPAELPAASAEFQKMYLQMPPLDPRIGNLTKLITKTITHPYRKAQALESYLRSNFGYSLELKGTPHSQDPLAMFLFDVRRGHCEYFASALTIMLRQTGIPSRLVNGFRTGEYNSIGSSWTVRQYDAHSWVEAYFPPYGWVDFDPTPPDPERSQFSVLKFISNLADAVDLWWFEEVVNYDTLKQVRMAVSARKQVLSLQERVRHLLEGWFSRGREKIDSLDLRSILASRSLLLTLLFLSLVSATLIVFLGKHGFNRKGFFFRLRRALAGGDGAVIIVSFYEEALDLLCSHGLAPTRGQTPLEFAQSIGREPISRPLVSLTEIYNRIRFGCRQGPEDLARADALLADLKAALQ